ncbi:radical SAM protein [Candidatus Magnetomorum sp. HK-1]|nr:radical SAM protein [Candidatus Magnetomorum sp. HK-1]
MIDIFISYSRFDSEKMNQLATVLRDRRLNVWSDQKIHGGAKFDDEIEKQLNLSKCVIVLWSENSISSDFVISEASRARKQNKLIPILLDQVSIPIEFERLHYINLVDWCIDASNPEFSKLIDSIDIYLADGQLTNTQTLNINNSDIKINNAKKLSINNKNLSLYKYSSWLPSDRKDDIINNYLKYVESGKLIEHRKQHIKCIKKKLKVIQKPFNEPAWTSISTTSSQCGHRLIIGFQNAGCEYRKKNNLGCFHCGFYAGAIPPPQSQLIGSLKSQFRRGLKIAKELFWKIDVIEFLSDGSFLNDNELPEKIKKEIFQSISKMPNIKRVLIESTPNKVYDERKEVAQRINGLREDQILEIGIGLETADDFIRQACFNKGYTIDEFEKAIKHVNNLDVGQKKRINIVAYIFVKPPFLKENESINDALQTIKYIYQLNKQSDVNIIPKLEPAIISNGTLLSLLWEEDQYMPLNYWMILEILCRIFFDEEISDILPKIRIGTRLDMDDSIKIPGIYRTEDGRFDQFDYVVYRAIQKFNQNKDLFELFYLIKTIYKSQKSNMLSHSQSLYKWIEKSGLSNNCAIKKFLKSNLFCKYEEEYNTVRSKDIDYIEEIIELLDVITSKNNRNIFIHNVTKLKNYLEDITSDESKKDISIFTKTDNLPIFINILNRIIDHAKHESFLSYLLVWKKRLEDIIHEYSQNLNSIDQEVSFSLNLFKLLDIVEGYTEDTVFLEYAKKWKKEFQDIKSIDEEISLIKRVRKKIQKELLRNFDFLEVYINDIYVEIKGSEMFRISMNLSDLIQQKTYEVWVGIPTK